MKKYFLMGLFLLSLSSCQSEIDKYYETPDWLKGNAYEVMMDKGDFSLFVEAVERSSYADLVKGKGIVTVMAPTDHAFNAYLTKHGYNSVQEIEKAELDILIGYHLIYYSYNKRNFMFYNPEGADKELEVPGAYFKFRTKSRDAISTVVDYANNGVTRKIMHKDRFIPIISDYSLNHWQTSPAQEYEKMFPGATYTGGTTGFNMANAGIEGDEIVTDNGYLYVIDQVLEPLETIYAEISKEGSEYSQFAAMYNRFVTYEYDQDATQDYGNGDSLFLHSHISLPPIANEWTSIVWAGVPDYAQSAFLSGISFSVLAPDNPAMDAFFQKYWAASFNSLEEVNYIPLQYFMNTHASGYMGKMVTASTLSSIIEYTDVFDGHTLTEPSYVKVCSNGVLGGMKGNVMMPEAFETPIAPALCDKKYNVFALIASRADLFDKFKVEYQKTFQVFFPSDEMLKRSEFNGDYIQYSKGNPYIINDEKVQVANSSDGTLGNITSSQSAAIAGAHIADDIISKRSDDELIYATYNDYEYLYKKEGKLYSSATWNAKALGNAVSVPEIELIKSYEMGNAYALIGDNTTTALLSDQGNFKDRIIQDKGMADYSGFTLYLNMTTVGKGDQAFNFVQGNRFLVFIPTQTGVLDDMRGNKRFPMSGTGLPAARDMYVKSMFIDVSSSGMLDYPFPTPGKASTKVLTTFGTKLVDGKREKITVSIINGADGSMKLRDSKGNEVNILSYFPYIYADGAAYVIDGVLDLLN